MNSVQTMRTTAPVKTYIGPDSSRMVGDLLREQGVDSVLIVTDKNIEAAGLLAGVEDSLRTAGCSFIVYDETPADPPDTAVDRMCALCWEKRCQAVIAVGGGSCIDSGKCVAFMQRNPGRIRDYLLDPTLPRRKGVPFIAIPTTSGTGSLICGNAHALAQRTDPLRENRGKELDGHGNGDGTGRAMRNVVVGTQNMGDRVPQAAGAVVDGHGSEIGGVHQVLPAGNILPVGQHCLQIAGDQAHSLTGEKAAGRVALSAEH